jgi:hypothetical protein
MEAISELLHSRSKKYQGLGDVVGEENYTQSLLVYAGVHWSSHQREACLPPDDPLITGILKLYPVDSTIYDISGSRVVASDETGWSPTDKSDTPRRTFGL